MPNAKFMKHPSNPQFLGQAPLPPSELSPPELLQPEQNVDQGTEPPAQPESEKLDTVTEGYESIEAPLPLKRKLRYRSLRFWATAKQRFVQLWTKNGGSWVWLEGKPMPLVGLNRKLWRIAEPSLNYLILLLLSGIISTFGLLAGSAATIIGAMIVAPLMGPIIAFAFAMVVGNRRLLKRSTLSLILGTALTVVSAWMIASIVGLDALNPEINARIRPTLIDLGVALAAGAAGTYANTHRGIADALPGVAIAVALVPPLSVVGIGLAMGSSTVAIGSTLLFLTNLTAIIFSGGLVFIWQEYGSLRRAQSGLTMAMIILSLLGLPLTLSMRELVLQAKAQNSIYALISRRTVTFSTTDIQRIRVLLKEGRLQVHVEVAAPQDSITEQQVVLVREFLERELERPIDLNVQVFPVHSFSATASEAQVLPISLSPWVKMFN